MKTLMFTLLVTGVAFASEYSLSIFINDEVVPWQTEADKTDTGFMTGEATLKVQFEGGWLELNLADWDTFDYAHILATDLRLSSSSTYTFSATVHHNDQGWDNYADAFEVKGDKVENGLRVLMHPHDNEQPFTRSQSNVEASGLVWLEAKDNVEGLGGSKIYLNLNELTITERFSIRYELEHLP